MKNIDIVWNSISMQIRYNYEFGVNIVVFIFAYVVHTQAPTPE